MVYLWYSHYRQSQPRAEESTDKDLFITGCGHFAHHDNEENEGDTIDGNAGNDEGGEEGFLGPIELARQS